MNGVWKWIAAILAAALLAGAPGYIRLLVGPTAQDVDRLRMQVRDLELQQARLSEQILVLQREIAQFLSNRPTGAR